MNHLTSIFAKFLLSWLPRRLGNHARDVKPNLEIVLHLYLETLYPTSHVYAEHTD